MKKNLCAVLLSICFYSLTYGQAYDGSGDYKVFIGYLNVDGNSGAEFQYDYGISDIFSSGGFVKYVSVEEGEYDDYYDSFNKLNVGVFLRGHLSEPLNLPMEMDPYVGLEVSFQSVGAHAGFKYNFGEVVGVYAQVSPSFSESLFQDDDRVNVYAKNVALSGGVTFYF